MSDCFSGLGSHPVMCSSLGADRFEESLVQGLGGASKSPLDHDFQEILQIYPALGPVAEIILHYLQSPDIGLPDLPEFFLPEEDLPSNSRFAGRVTLSLCAASNRKSPHRSSIPSGGVRRASTFPFFYLSPCPPAISFSETLDFIFPE